MGRLTTRLRLGMFLAAAVFIAAGCATYAAYQKAGEPGGNGYDEKALDTPGSFQIDYMAEGKTLAFAKYAAYYRAAELAFETGFRYFIPLKAYDLTHKGKAWMDPRTATDVVPGVRIIIQCYQTKPAQPSYDVYQYLNTVPVPGTQDYFAVSQRRGDQATLSGK